MLVPKWISEHKTFRSTKSVNEKIAWFEIFYLKKINALKYIWRIIHYSLQYLYTSSHLPIKFRNQIPPLLVHYISCCYQRHFSVKSTIINREPSPLTTQIKDASDDNNSSAFKGGKRGEEAEFRHGGKIYDLWSA